MRVLLVSHRYPPDGVAGVERITQTLAAELAVRGDHASVVARQTTQRGDSPRLVRERLPDGTALYRIRGGEAVLDHFLQDHLRLERLFTAALLEARPDVVHVMHLLGLSPRFVEMAHRHHAAVVISLQDFYFSCPLILLRKPSGALCEGPQGGAECAATCFPDAAGHSALRWGVRAAYFRRVLAMAERIICPSRYVASYFERSGADCRRIRVIPNGVSISPAAGYTDRAPAPCAPGTLNLAYLGSVVEHKGLHVVLQSLAMAALDSVNLAVWGKVEQPAYAAKVRRQGSEIPGLTVTFHGAYEPDELPSRLAAVDCVIVPSQWPETFAIVTREALMCGVPILVSRLGALPDAVVDGHNGFTFDAHSPRELATILHRLIEEPGLLPRLQAAARGTPVVTVGQHAAAVRAVYEEAIRELEAGGSTLPGDLDEFRFLHNALLQLGCG